MSERAENIKRTLPGKLHGKLKWYSAMMAGAFLVQASPGIADVYYSGDQSLAVGLGGTRIDLDNDGTDDFRLICYAYSSFTNGLTYSSNSCYIEKWAGGSIGIDSFSNDLQSFMEELQEKGLLGDAG